MGVETVLLVASTAVGAYSAIESGRQQKEWADYQAAQSQADANAARQAAVLEAEKIRKLTKRQQSEAAAAMAASGVDVSSPTALHINKDIYQRGEEDAITTILNGNYRQNQLNAQAQAQHAQGNQAQTAGYINASSSVLAGYRNYLKPGWRT